MRIGLAASLGAAFLGAFSSAAFAQEDTRPALQARLIAAAAAQGYGTEGAQLGLDRGVPMEKSVRYAFALKAGETYYVVGGCDANCTAVALMMTDANSSGIEYSKDGEIVAHTPLDGEAHPAFTLTAKKTTTYSIVIHVSECHGPQQTCVAGAAVFHKSAQPDAGWVRTPKFTIDPKGNVTLEKAFTAETFCVVDSLDEDTAAAIGSAMAYNETNAEATRKVLVSLSTCAAKYGWSPRERELALTMAGTQTLIDYLLNPLDAVDVDYDDIVEIADSLTTEQAKKFADGSWQHDDFMIAKLVAGLQAHGANDDKILLNMGEMAVGGYANQAAAVRAWVDLLKPK